jgi:hypothetical protein
MAFAAILGNSPATVASATVAKLEAQLAAHLARIAEHNAVLQKKAKEAEARKLLTDPTEIEEARKKAEYEAKYLTLGPILEAEIKEGEAWKTNFLIESIKRVVARSLLAERLAREKLLERRGELLQDVLGIACCVGYGLDLHHTRYLCGNTFRLGVKRADGSLDRTGFLGATADLIKSSCRLQGLDAARTSPREENTTQLGRAVLERDETLVRKLIAAGADLNAVDANGNSPLHLVSRGKENFNVLLKQGKNIVRIADGDARIITLLLDGKYEGKGANINLRNAKGATPLHYACGSLNEAAVIRLLENGADVTGARGIGSSNKYYSESSIPQLLWEHGAK